MLTHGRPGWSWRRDVYAHGCVVVYRRSPWRLLGCWLATVVVFLLLAIGLIS